MMTLAFSRKLSRILNSHRQQGGDEELELGAIVQSVIESFAEDSRKAEAFLGRANGKASMRRLIHDITLLVPHDSVVRDLGTTGHLAKVLSRLDILERTKNYDLVGLPHRLFDALSQQERTAFIEENGSHPVDAKLLELSEAKDLVTRESKIFAALSEG